MYSRWLEILRIVLQVEGVVLCTYQCYVPLPPYGPDDDYVDLNEEDAPVVGNSINSEGLKYGNVFFEGI